MTDQVMPENVAVADIDSAISWLKEKYRDAVVDDNREGYQGVIIDRSRLVEVATAIRDELGFDYLSSATAVDYLGLGEPDSDMEMVYHTYRIAGGPALVFKAQTPRDNAELPSLVQVWPGAGFQEREAFDLMPMKFQRVKFQSI